MQHFSQLPHWTFEDAYLNVLDTLLSAPVRGDRTGTGTHSVFGTQLRFDLQQAFPLLTTKQVPLRLIFHELKWMLNGDTNIKYLLDNNVHIWTDWPLKRYRNNIDDMEFSQEQFEESVRTNTVFAERWGDCGPIYGYQWRKWPSTSFSRSEPIDQIVDTLKQLHENPESRRMIVSAWNVADIPDMIPSGLPPCHMTMQFYTRPLSLTERRSMGTMDGTIVPERYLDCQVYIRFLRERLH